MKFLTLIGLGSDARRQAPQPAVDMKFLTLIGFGSEARREALRPAVAEFKRMERTVQAVAELQASQSRPRDERGSRRYFPPEVREAQVLDLLASRPEAYRRVDVAEELGLTKARAGQIVNGLIAGDLVEERGRGTLGLTSKAQRISEGQHPEQPPMKITSTPMAVPPLERPE